jgi:hypothetical protein
MSNKDEAKDPPTKSINDKQDSNSIQSSSRLHNSQPTIQVCPKMDELAQEAVISKRETLQIQQRS